MGEGVASTNTVKLELILDPFQGFVGLPLQQARGRKRLKHEQKIFIIHHKEIG